MSYQRLTIQTATVVVFTISTKIQLSPVLKLINKPVFSCCSPAVNLLKASLELSVNLRRETGIVAQTKAARSLFPPRAAQ